jgi:hypothetical protein
MTALTDDEVARTSQGTGRLLESRRMIGVDLTTKTPKQMRFSLGSRKRPCELHTSPDSPRCLEPRTKACFTALCYGSRFLT